MCLINMYQVLCSHLVISLRYGPYKIYAPCSIDAGAAICYTFFIGKFTVISVFI